PGLTVVIAHAWWSIMTGLAPVLSDAQQSSAGAPNRGHIPGQRQRGLLGSVRSAVPANQVIFGREDATPTAGEISRQRSDVIRRRSASRSPSAKAFARSVSYSALDPICRSGRGARGGVRRASPSRSCLRRLPPA